MVINSFSWHIMFILLPKRIHLCNSSLDSLKWKGKNADELRSQLVNENVWAMQNKKKKMGNMKTPCSFAFKWFNRHQRSCIEFACLFLFGCKKSLNQQKRGEKIACMFLHLIKLNSFRFANANSVYSLCVRFAAQIRSTNSGIWIEVAKAAEK